MLDFKHISFELEELKTGKGGKVYELSHDSLYGISKDTLSELIKEEQRLSEAEFELLEPEVLSYLYTQIKNNLSDEEINGLSVESLKNILGNEIYHKEYYEGDISKEELLSIIDNDSTTREELLTILNKKLLSIYSVDNFDFFGIKDPRKTELSDDKKEFYTEQNFPKTAWTLLTHGTYAVPSVIRSKVKAEIKDILLKEDTGVDLESDEVKAELKNQYSIFLRILKQFSDFATRYVVKHSFIPKDQIIQAGNSRGITDPAREIDEKLMLEDFYNNELPESLRSETRMGKINHMIYHLGISDMIEEIVKQYGGVTIVDDHDTGILDIGQSMNDDKYDDGGFPLITLGTKDGASCNPEILEYYAERIKYHLGVKPLINAPYKGGYVTTKHGVEARSKLEEKGKNPGVVNVIQQEVGKFLYLDERTQEVDHDKAELIGIGLARAKADLGRKFGSEYYKALNKGEEAVAEYLDNYKEIV